jgi:GcrA cell cycle regulator
MSEADLPEGSAETLPLADCFVDQEPIEGRLTVVDLRESSCRWPSGNPRDLTTFRYCGGARSHGPYCERHARLAYFVRAA